ncbi:hypothetical protein [Candidiatus Paracoxiella cheracis]|uniref:hypothetical protein n=1 Tax=Candidiatus Paracoxiella cheracis TaxID=3405120 RepID=UPI003BF5BE94
MVRDELMKNQQEATFMGQVNTLNTELYQARQDDASFNALCEGLPQDVAQKFFAVFAGQDNAVAMIKTILHDKGLSEAFINCQACRDARDRLLPSLSIIDSQYATT